MFNGNTFYSLKTFQMTFFFILNERTPQSHAHAHKCIITFRMNDNKIDAVNVYQTTSRENNQRRHINKKTVRINTAAKGKFNLFETFKQFSTNVISF